MSKRSKKYKWVTQDKYSWRCECGKPAWVKAKEGLLCRECHDKVIELRSHSNEKSQDSQI